MGRSKAMQKSKPMRRSKPLRDFPANEVLLYFIWKFRYFNHRELTAESGEPLFIHFPGDRNTDQGPDFRNARISIGDTMLEGAVELHVRAGDWLRHGHTGDPHYQRVILHVVWENDTIAPPAGIPILTLQDKTPLTLLPLYRQFMTSQSFVPCERLLPQSNFATPASNLATPASNFAKPASNFFKPASNLATPASNFAKSASNFFKPASNLTGSASPGHPWAPFRQTLLLQRLGHRTAFIRTLLDENNPHWDQTIFRLIARSPGQPVNTDAFLTIATSFPLNFLLRRRSDPDRLETLFVEKAASLAQPLSHSRMRPAHAPYTRLRQLAAILARYTGWFTTLLESDHPAAILHTLDVDGLGPQTKRSILINAHSPLLYAYATLRQEPRQRDKALRWLDQMPPEDNTIIRRWRELGMPAATAADTQALLELKKNFCTPKGCLDCRIGRSLLTTPVQPSAAPTPAPASENLPSPPYRDGYSA